MEAAITSELPSGRMLEGNYFELFGLPPLQAVDQERLRKAHLGLMRHFHPDLFSAGTEQEKILADRYAAHINGAFKVLSCPLRRAAYLLELRGVRQDPEQTVVQDLAFLEQQMQLREELELARRPGRESELESLRRQLQTSWRQLEAQFEQQLAAEEWALAKQTLARMHFVHQIKSQAAPLATGMS